MSAPEGFTTFVTECSHRLLRAAWMLTGDVARAEDLLQTVLAMAWRKWGAISSTGNPEAYVRQMLFTTYVTWWRRRWRAEVPTERLPDRGLPERMADEAANRDLINRALAKVSRQQRAILVLRFLEDLSVAETAEVLGCSQGTVTTQTSRAFVILRTNPHLLESRTEVVRP
jgi:RNA polymerase sigma-70 factor (sigma-E family)